ncbi:MAG: hypothetical protein TU36_005560 [Vulcanisaeta sp. AZ3]|jgi:hypothetical protein|nr:MAG: hypothetical protein TU36_05765 [Vulcanisaeta sp. AZ3]
MASRLQRDLKSIVDQTLKNLETNSLKYTRVGVKDFKAGLEVYIKIYLEHPMKLGSIYELVKALTSKYNIQPNDILIYAPHSRAIRLTFTIKGAAKQH